jgi:hypothetical protein
MARRDERAYREYVSEEQRSQMGCVGFHMWELILLQGLRDGKINQP